ncbi:hypothetical protein SISSUDRAFT_1121538 [Sistotremastrum suecicum HHB10207 ss-3]|uniref:Uncharacterized protein n=1 Tax=Sistotremastrum suecicum HHB10207 ss-3 TaxID=1314776 RepID=A0A166AP32_9AGAM|nr:hypothetical protein SISSUDRAFT_1121538 [Sistotremastrum suecicum HHB10207 ss-3]
MSHELKRDRSFLKRLRTSTMSFVANSSSYMRSPQLDTPPSSTEIPEKPRFESSCGSDSMQLQTPPMSPLEWQDVTTFPTGCDPTRYYETMEDLEDKSNIVEKGKTPESPVTFNLPPYDSPDSFDLSESALHDVDEADASEWYGLERTLELSRRDRRGSVDDEESIGEFSKSRESWAVIHGAYIPAGLEEQHYREWRKWHRIVDHRMRLRKNESQILASKMERKAWLASLRADTQRNRNFIFNRDLRAHSTRPSLTRWSKSCSDLLDCN